MKIVFFGTPSFVQPVLETLQKNFNVVGTFNSSQEFNNLTIGQLNNLSPDLFVTAAYGKLLSPELLNIPKYGVLNIHPSLLPSYRGPSPIQAAILHNDSKSGITIFKVDEKMDHGPILTTKKVVLSPTDTLESLSIKMFQEAANMLLSIINDYIEQKIIPIPQNDAIATYCKMIKKEDGYINLAHPLNPQQLDRMIRAYHPWPSTWTRIKLGVEPLKVVRFLPEKKIQVEGGKPMSYKDFLNGYPEARKILPILQISTDI